MQVQILHCGHVIVQIQFAMNQCVLTIDVPIPFGTPQRHGRATLDTTHIKEVLFQTIKSFQIWSFGQPIVVHVQYFQVGHARHKLWVNRRQRVVVQVQLCHVGKGTQLKWLTTVAQSIVFQINCSQSMTQGSIKRTCVNVGDEIVFQINVQDGFGYIVDVD